MKNRRHVSMDPAVKTALGLCVLLAGVFTAQLFRKDRPPPSGPAATSGQEQLLLRQDGGAATACLKAIGRFVPGRCGTPTSPPAGIRPAIVVTPLDRREPPPSRSPEYPEPNRPVSPPRDTSSNMMPPIAAPTGQTARSHTVVDGDTLPALAERYLGASSRAEEIYRANRDVLSSPDLLPIGARLKLPPRNR